MSELPLEQLVAVSTKALARVKELEAEVEQLKAERDESLAILRRIDAALKRIADSYTHA